LPNREIAVPASVAATAEPASKAQIEGAMSTKAALLPQMARLFAARAGLYCVSALIAGALGIAAITAVTITSFSVLSGGPSDPVSLWRSMTFSRQLIFIFGSLFGLLTPILLAARAVCRITSDQISGHASSLATVVGDMARFFPSALVYSPIIGFPAMIGSAMLFLPGIVIASLFALVVPTSTQEAAGIFAILRRGLSLCGKVFGKVLVLSLASFALLVIVLVLRINLLDRFLSGAPAMLFVLRISLTYVPALLVLILANICFTLIYREASEQEAPSSAKAIGAIQS
jgi:hypothetical protein